MSSKKSKKIVKKYNSPIGVNIKALRNGKKLSQAELGKLVNVTRGQVSNYESGNNLPSIDILLQLCVILDTSPNDLMGYVKPGTDLEQEIKKEKLEKDNQSIFESINQLKQRIVELSADKEELKNDKAELRKRLDELKR